MDLAQAAKQLQRARNAIKANEQIVKDITAQFAEYAEDDYVAGDLILKVGRTRRFDAATAKRNLTPVEYNKILVRKPDSTLAKTKLTEDVYEDCQKDFGVTVKVVVPEVLVP